ncbi:flagellar hook protein FlgE [Pararhizobium sp.]|uniref:flagellar hook protein FlgE n=1 Tax=Pararhizobium sp. TaxID=1977563 RepID=UPI0027281963|nr:flagellar hook protein FlgE [Pararhizobium sp.]MDO9418250.1 flagellar hook protein FlgE [Pararhizobium sp.]
MSLYGMLRTGGSGMNAQANKLGTVAENIANANTTGYKRASTEFSSMILPSSGGAYNSGGVQTSVRYAISEQGASTYTTSASDLAIDGEGFFVVQGAKEKFLTRAGSFVIDGDGYFKNAAGYTLTGKAYQEGVEPPIVINGLDDLVPIKMDSGELRAVGSTTGAIGSNLPNDAVVGAEYTTSLVVYDTQGNTRFLDFVYEKTSPNNWSVEVRDRVGYAANPATGVIGTAALVFDATGALTAPVTVTTTAIAGLSTGANLNALTIDLGKTTQLGYAFNPDGGTIDGSKPSKVSGYQISKDGIIYVKYEDGTLDPKFRIGMASVRSPDNLVPQSGNVYSQGVDSGVIVAGVAGSGNFGEILSGALEGSNVDIAAELTAMIESQRSYTANSKVFQTGADLLDVLVNLKR